METEEWLRKHRTKRYESSEGNTPAAAVVAVAVVMHLKRPGKMSEDRLKYQKFLL